MTYEAALEQIAKHMGPSYAQLIDYHTRQLELQIEHLRAPLSALGSASFRVLHAKDYPGVPATIPWALIEPHAEQAQTNHMQTLQRLNERGGLSPDEMVAVLDDRRWRAMTREEAAQRLLEILANAKIRDGEDRASHSL